MEIVQIPLTDQQKLLDNVRVRNFFILNECLDEEVLRNALNSLIRYHWRKLGARVVKRRTDGLLEFHLPIKFQENYALFNWTSQTYDHSIDQITTLASEPALGGGVVLLPPVTLIENYLRPAKWPIERKRDPTDSPLLYISVSTFVDSTVVAVSFPHVVGDQMGLGKIMKAWLGMIKGEAPPPLLGLTEDILANGKSYADYPRNDLLRTGRMRVRQPLEYFMVCLGLVPEIVFVYPGEVSHTIFLPLPVIETLREKFARAAVEKYGADPGISNGDVITSILLKFSQIHARSARMIALSQIVNLRGRIPQLEHDPDGFIQNALNYSVVHFQYHPSTQLSEVAYLNRLAIIQAEDTKDIEIGLAVIREMALQHQTTHICEPFEMSHYVSNWCAAWKDLDFSPAVKGKGDVSNKYEKPKMIVLGDSHEPGTPKRFVSNIFCKTEHGYWCDFTANSRGSKLIEEYLKKDPMLNEL